MGNDVGIQHKISRVVERYAKNELFPKFTFNIFHVSSNSNHSIRTLQKK
jgi:hypothetical protein